PKLRIRLRRRTLVTAASSDPARCLISSCQGLLSSFGPPGGGPADWSERGAGVLLPAAAAESLRPWTSVSGGRFLKITALLSRRNSSKRSPKRLAVTSALAAS